MRCLFRTIVFAACAVLLAAAPADAYIGPGAGFAFISSFFILIVAFLLAVFTVLSWPFRAVILYVQRRKARRASKIKRMIIVGFDGLDPGLCRLYMAAGKLPNLSRLSTNGSFQPLQTTVPAISPVAWSSFATGVNPGKHNIFDFFTRDTKTYMPVLSSALISTHKGTLKLGPFKIPRSKAVVSLLRKSTAVWTILGKSKIFSTVLRVPITFPPEKFYGSCLSAMCTPDLLGTQGSFTLFTSQPENSAEDGSKGRLVRLKMNTDGFHARIDGPSIREDGDDATPSVAISGTVDRAAKSVRLQIGKEVLRLAQGEYSPWVRLEFKVGVRKSIKGIVRFMVTAVEPHLTIYMTPINIDPEKPTLPISHPFYYAICLSKLHGSYSTLGLAEDTWALNEGVIDEGAFLEQAYDIYEERKALLLDNLRRTKEGLMVLVFDTTDRIQHMFFRYLDSDHPANQGKDTTRFKDSIEQLYAKMDVLVGDVVKQLRKDDVLLIISDHGFKPFKWGVNLNTWLWKEGYLVLEEGAEPGGDWFAGVDWSKTRAYAYGLAGIFINTRGRERLGEVVPGEQKRALLAELKEKLENLHDEHNDRKPVRRALIAHDCLHGPYTADAPDILVGYESGYRSSWNCATGKITQQVIEKNTKAWSGDHSIDPELVPGVFFSNWKLKSTAPSLIDIAPTILSLFGLEQQRFHDGSALDLRPPSAADTQGGTPC